MCKTLRICCLLVKQVISKIIDSTYQERMKYLFKGQKNWIPCRMKAVFTAKVLGWICSPLIYSAYPRAWHRIGLSIPWYSLIKTHVAHILQLLQDSSYIMSASSQVKICRRRLWHTVSWIENKSLFQTNIQYCTTRSTYLL